MIALSILLIVLGYLIAYFVGYVRGLRAQTEWVKKMAEGWKEVGYKAGLTKRIEDGIADAEARLDAYEAGE